ncbi:hypothetical protein ADK67_12385 [Saccharothrix sp. NRRL B-16348]|uniref:hypothetical protein n=1 Tax=Saccharothrix sp. NRRL B-16348 TaxID=1415542 RepID=UPI0006B03C51|nr:hypothetical protein [Saccharothrix sp. NRRL B-16348]KOX28213.1 hypothetical protein ADK67_12385 [Saccharothrix sp. NRRL B-16348]
MNVSALSWVFFTQGRLDDAETAALRQAEQLQPDFVRGSAESLTVWAILMLRRLSPDTATAPRCGTRCR